MVINLRSAGSIAMIWLATVAGVSATAWVAIDRAGQDISGASFSPLPVRTHTGTLSSPATGTAATASPSTTPRPTSTRRPATRVAPTARDRTISVEGGLVTVRCTGAAMGLRVAQPDNDWQVHVDTSGAGRIFVQFVNGDEDDGGATQVTAVCTNGTPAFGVTKT